MSVVAVHKSSQLVTNCSLSWKGYKSFKRFKILVATHSNSPSKSGWGMGGWSITHTDLVAHHTKLVVMSWDVMGCCVLSASCQKWQVTHELLQVATILKATSRELLRHLESLL